MASFCFSYRTGPDQQTPEQPARPAASPVFLAHYERTEINKIYVDVDIDVDATNFDSPQSSEWNRDAFFE